MEIMEVYSYKDRIDPEIVYSSWDDVFTRSTKIIEYTKIGPTSCIDDMYYQWEYSTSKYLKTLNIRNNFGIFSDNKRLKLAQNISFGIIDAEKEKLLCSTIRQIIFKEVSILNLIRTSISETRNNKNKITNIKLDISKKVSTVYKKIKVTTDDIKTDGMKIIGAGDCDILLGRKNEQVFILVQNVLNYHDTIQDVEELYFSLKESKKSSKKLLQPKNTNASTSEKRKHIIQVVGEVNRTIKNRSGVEKLLTMQTKGLSTKKIKLSLNLNLGKTSG